MSVLHSRDYCSTLKRLQPHQVLCGHELLSERTPVENEKLGVRSPSTPPNSSQASNPVGLLTCQPASPFSPCLSHDFPAMMSSLVGRCCCAISLSLSLSLSLSPLPPSLSLPPSLPLYLSIYLSCTLPVYQPHCWLPGQHPQRRCPKHAQLRPHPPLPSLLGQANIFGRNHRLACQAWVGDGENEGDIHVSLD